MPKTDNQTKHKLEGVDELSLAVFLALRDAMRANGHAMAKRFAAKGAHIGQAACLRVLDENDGITQSDMAKILHVSRPSITGMLRTVEKSGAIIRKPDEADQRIIRVYLTDKGQAMAAKLRSVLSDYINQTIGLMTERDRRELTRLLNKLNTKIASASKGEDAAE